MAVPQALEWSLQLGSGACWTAVYVLLIRRARLDGAVGMPFAALCANVAWEFTFTAIRPHDFPQIYVNAAWLTLDLVILAQTWRYRRGSLPGPLSGRFAAASFALSLALAFGLVLSLSDELRDADGKYAAFGQNLLMSVLFVTRLLGGGSTAGQSMMIALLKMIGTLLPSILFHLLFPGSRLLNLLYVSIFFFDALYVFLLGARLREEGLDPWSRAPKRGDEGGETPVTEGAAG